MTKADNEITVSEVILSHETIETISVNKYEYLRLIEKCRSISNKGEVWQFIEIIFQQSFGCETLTLDTNCPSWGFLEIEASDKNSISRQKLGGIVNYYFSSPSNNQSERGRRFKAKKFIESNNLWLGFAKRCYEEGVHLDFGDEILFPWIFMKDNVRPARYGITLKQCKKEDFAINHGNGESHGPDGQIPADSELSNCEIHYYLETKEQSLWFDRFDLYSKTKTARRFGLISLSIYGLGCVCVLSFAFIEAQSVIDFALRLLFYAVLLAIVLSIFQSPVFHLSDWSLARRSLAARAWLGETKLWRYRADTDPCRVELVSFTAECPMCDASKRNRIVRLRYGGRQFPNRFVGRCVLCPEEHVFSFDSMNEKGKRLL